MIIKLLQSIVKAFFLHIFEENIHHEKIYYHHFRPYFNICL